MIQSSGNFVAPQTGVWSPPVWNQPRIQTRNQAFADANLGDPFIGFNIFTGEHNPPRGFGLDLNNDGKFDPKKDGFLSFDLNGDGQHTDQEITQSRNLLKAFSGDFDVNADGRVDYGEYFQGYQNYFQSRAMDIDRDGVLSNWELKKAGGAVVKENKSFLEGPILNSEGYSERVGHQKWSSYSLDNMPGGGRLDYLNPWNRTFLSSKPDFFSFPYDRIPHQENPIAAVNGGPW